MLDAGDSGVAGDAGRPGISSIGVPSRVDSVGREAGGFGGAPVDVDALGVGGEASSARDGFGGEPSVADGNVGGDPSYQGASGAPAAGGWYSCNEDPGSVEIPVPEALWTDGGTLELAAIDRRDGHSLSTTVELVMPDTRTVVTSGPADGTIAYSFLTPTGTLVHSAINLTSCGIEHVAPREGLPLRVPDDYSTIQAAIDAADPGDTVLVGPGTYTERVSLAPGVHLLGSGPDQTTLDGHGIGGSLVELIRAYGASVRGFRFINVGPSSTCGSPDDMFRCAAEHYPAGVSASGAKPPPFCCSLTAALIADNVFEDNHTGVLVGHSAVAVVRNNIFRNNTNGVFATGGDSDTLVANNVFYGNDGMAIGSGLGAYPHVQHNVIAHSGVGIGQERPGAADIRCNAFFGNGENGTSVSIDLDGNTSFDSPPSLEGAAAAGCFGESADAGGLSWGAFAGSLGEVFEQSLDATP